MDDRRCALVEDHIHLVDHVVARVAPTLPAHLDRSELLSAGRLGLTEAADRYDPGTGVPFGAFAMHRIRGAVLDVARSFDYLPARVRAMQRRAADTAQVLQSEQGEPPTDRELADALLVSPVDLRRLRRQVATGPACSLDAPTATDRPLSETMFDPGQLDPEERSEERALLEGVRAAISRLPERLRVAITATYLEGRSGLEVSELLGVSPSRVSQLRAEGLLRLREELADIVDVRTGPVVEPIS
jgi:RNA polymerase sigma factor for flagellar operon FliA